MFWGHDQAFWSTVLGATILRLLTADYDGLTAVSFFRAFAVAAFAIFAAVVFTEPTIAYLTLNPDVYKVPVAALWALTGEGLIRMLMRLTSDFKNLIEAFKLWRGK
jgi:hypothetical protein